MPEFFYLIHPLYLDCLLTILGFRVFFCVFCFIVQHHSSNFSHHHSFRFVLKIF